MNYRHEFHAGNFADVMKHIALVLMIERLKVKEKPFVVLDTHAGSGTYDLASDEARRGGEWQHGIGRLLGAADAGSVPKPLAGTLAPYLRLIRDPALIDNTPSCYPGSALLAARFLRQQDRLVANELHPEAFDRLSSSLRGSGCLARLTVTQGDGWSMVKATLPPPERRGIVLIDPPFEQPNELARLAEALREGHKRFATGIFVLWYAIKDRRDIARFHRKLSELGLPKLQAFELMIQSDRVTTRMNGAGLIVANAPFGFEAAYAPVLEFLARLLAAGPGGGSRIIAL